MNDQPYMAIISNAQRRHTLRISSALVTENCEWPSPQPWISQGSGDFRISIPSDIFTLSGLSHDFLRTVEAFQLRSVCCCETLTLHITALMDACPRAPRAAHNAGYGCDFVPRA